MDQFLQNTDVGNIERLIHNLEFENQSCVKLIENENQLIEALDNELKQSKCLITEFQEKASMLDEETKHVHKQYTYNRDNCQSLKKTSVVLKEHDDILDKKLEALEETHRHERNGRQEIVDHYTDIWEDYEAKYKQFPLVKTLEEKQQHVLSLEKDLQENECKMQELDLKINKINESKNDELRNLNKFIVNLAAVKLSTEAISTQIKQVVDEKKQTQAEIDKATAENEARKQEEARELAVVGDEEHITAKVPDEVSCPPPNPPTQLNMETEEASDDGGSLLISMYSDKQDELDDGKEVEPRPKPSLQPTICHPLVVSPQTQDNTCTQPSQIPHDQQQQSRNWEQQQMYQQQSQQVQRQPNIQVPYQRYQTPGGQTVGIPTQGNTKVPLPPHTQFTQPNIPSLTSSMNLPQVPQHIGRPASVPPKVTPQYMSTVTNPQPSHSVSRPQSVPRIPNINQLPTGSRAPTINQVPTALRTPANNQIPSVLRPPANNQIPSVLRPPANNQVPSVLRPPANNQIPTSLRPPASNQVPTILRAPVNNQVPTILRAPSNNQVPTGSRTPNLHQVPTGSRTPNLHQVPTGSRTPNLHQVPTALRTPNLNQVATRPRTPTSNNQGQPGHGSRTPTSREHLVSPSSGIDSQVTSSPVTTTRQQSPGYFPKSPAASGAKSKEASPFDFDKHQQQRKLLTKSPGAMNYSTRTMFSACQTDAFDNNGGSFNPFMAEANSSFRIGSGATFEDGQTMNLFGGDKACNFFGNGNTNSADVCSRPSGDSAMSLFGGAEKTLSPNGGTQETSFSFSFGGGGGGGGEESGASSGGDSLMSLFGGGVSAQNNNTQESSFSFSFGGDSDLADSPRGFSLF